MNNLIPHSPGVSGFRNPAQYRTHIARRTSASHGFREREYLTRVSPWISAIVNDNTDENTKWKAWKYRRSASVTLLFWRCTITRLLIHSWGDRGRMIHRRDTISQRTTRVEFRDKGESAPRREHATGIFRLSFQGTSTQIKSRREVVFLTRKSKPSYICCGRISRW